MHRTTVLGGLAAAVLGLVVVPPAAVGASTAGTGPASPDTVLAQPLAGRAAVAALGSRVEAVAARQGLTAARYTHLLESDATVRADRSGALHVVDPAASATELAAAATEVVARGPFPSAQTFTLHSRPGANRTIYLDFTGATVSATAWNTSYGVAASHPAFDLDGAPGTFSQAERDVVQSVWQRVAEDYAPFAVDVTTQDPGAAALERSSTADAVFGTRVLVSPSTNAINQICGGSCGGVAFVGTFDSVGSAQYQPAWVFPQALGNSAKNIAEAASHEAGHNLGLSHDGTATIGYYAGHANWAPIMGVGYSHPVSQWSRGEYTGANNTEDDVAVIAANGAAKRADDAGGTTGTAVTLTGAGTRSGVISARTDKDVYRLRLTCTGAFSATVDPAPTSPNLDVKLRLLSATGAQLVVSNPASGQVNGDVASGLSASVGGTRAAGTYFLEVDGVGNGGGAAGYSDYGSLGSYTLRTTGCLA